MRVLRGGKKGIRPAASGKTSDVNVALVPRRSDLGKSANLRSFPSRFHVGSLGPKNCIMAFTARGVFRNDFERDQRRGREDDAGNPPEKTAKP